MLIFQSRPVMGTGYRPVRGYNLNYEGDGDLSETLFVQWEPKSGPSPKGQRWPPAAPDFRTQCLDYYDAALTLRDQISVLFALAIEQPEDFLKEKEHISRMRFIHYPEGAQAGNGMGAHTDPGIFTILYQQPGSKGLQVLTPENEWIDVPAVPGHLIVHFGDQMGCLTNDVFRSPLHRVVTQPGTERYSIAMFSYVDVNVAFGPLAQFVSAARPAKYETVVPQDEYKKLETRYLRDSKL
ncbi:hypothetical protein B0H17DRAFT_1179204 [Mycena rosella]|uniref:Fe2OG dioxygenase domain-containing protein n=1 Tax=Mycena rosella TaxID=1033263 RepID=A0AAD7DJS9_MYCRO|nr:hypothetical protein B0H17DRAFT_1179204 [Mycena rosella]